MAAAAQPDLQRREACPACLASSGLGRPLGESGGFVLLTCHRCGTVFTDRLPAREEAEDYDAYYDEGNLDVPPLVHARLGDLVESLAAHRRTNRWLDVGCGAGALLRAAQAHGWAASGTEVASRPVERLAAAGFDARLGELEAVGFEEDAFDVVTLIEVVEHVPDPGRLLDEVARVLRPGGVAYLTTPNGAGLSRRLLGARWSVVSPPEHLQLFSVRGARLLLDRTGLPAYQVQTHAVNPHELLNRLRRNSEGFDRVQAGYALNATLSSTGWGAAFKGGVNALLSVTRLGDTIKVRARKPSPGQE